MRQKQYGGKKFLSKKKTKHELKTFKTNKLTKQKKHEPKTIRPIKISQQKTENIPVRYSKILK